MTPHSKSAPPSVDDDATEAPAQSLQVRPAGSVAAEEYFSRKSKATRDEMLGARDQIHQQRALGLFVVRESDQWDKVLFDAIRDRTYLPHRNVPEVEAVRQAGMQPLTLESFTVSMSLPDGTARQTQVFVESCMSGRTKAVLFSFGGYWHLWCQASAAKVDDEKGINDFTAILVQVVRRLRPKTVYAANFSRLVRSMSQAHKLADAFSECVDEVCVGELKFDFAGSSPVGHLMVTMLSWAAAMERDAIVTRLLAGRIAKWRRNEWPFGDHTIPFGYRLDEKRLVPDESQKTIVRRMLLILSSDLPPGEMIRQLDDAGVTSMRSHRRLQEKSPLGALTSPYAAVNALYSWGSLYVTGEFLFRLASSFRGIDELAGVPISRFEVEGTGLPDQGDPGEMQMLYDVGVPDGGWAEPEILEAFTLRASQHFRALVSRGRTHNRPMTAPVAASSEDVSLLQTFLPSQASMGNDRVSQQRRNAAAAKAVVSPLTGRGFHDGEYYYEMQTVTTGRMRMSRWRIDDSFDLEGVFERPKFPGTSAGDSHGGGR